MSPTHDDTHLLAAWHVQRDTDAFRALCDRYCGLVAATSRRQGSPDVAEAVQAVFLVLARRAGLVSGTSLGGWLTATAKRVVKDQHRDAARRRRHEQEAAVEQARQRVADGADPVWEEARQHLDAALASLSAGRREAILRFYLAGRPQAEVAAELGCSVDAVKTRVHEGIEGLRRFFARKGIALGAVAVVSGLVSEATASELTMVATCVQTVLTPATAPGAAALAHGVVTAMVIKTATLVAAGLVLVGSCLTAALVVGAESAPTPAAASTPQTSTETPSIRSVVITPRDGDAWEVFRDLERQGGPQVFVFGRNLFRPWLVVPVELRFQAVEGRKLVEAVAATRALRTAWVRGGTAAVLYEGVSDGDVERAQKELASADAVVRREAAWRAGWLGDVRVVPLLVKAAKDIDAEVARRALVGLRRLSWAVVVLLDETAVTMLSAELDPFDATMRCDVVQALGHVGGDKALGLLEKALADHDSRVLRAATEALGRVGGDTAQALLEKTLASKNPMARRGAAEALVSIGGDKALVFLEKALTNQDVSERYWAAQMLGRVGGDKALALLEKALTDQEKSVRTAAASALGYVGGDRSLALLEKALANQDISVRAGATYTLGRVGGDKALA